MKRMHWILLALGLMAGTAQADDTTLSVHVRETVLRERPSFLGKVVGQLRYGDRVQVVARQGPWRRIQGPDIDGAGWVHASALNRKRVVLRAGADDVKSAASGEELALAGKGFNSNVESKYKSRNPALDFTWIDRMEQIDYPLGELEAFLRKGGLGDAGGSP